MEAVAITQKNKQRAQVAIHILVWGLLFSIPILFAPNNISEDIPRIFRPWLPLFFSIVVFYFNYFFLIRKYLFQQKVWTFLLVNVLLILICVLLMSELHTLIFDTRPPRITARLQNRIIFRPNRGFTYFLDSMTLILMAGISVAIKVTARWYQEENIRKEMAREHLQSELSLLKHQLNPHFFFNTLNNIYSLVELRPEHAKEAIHRLGKLMRYLLYESEAEEVTLTKEINFLRHYIDLMRLRLPAHVAVKVDFPGEPKEEKIAPLLFVSLVENAFKHGVSATKPSSIHISLQQKQDGTIEFLTENSLFPKSTDDKSGSGIGLNNLRKRLNLLYPHRHDLGLTNENGTYKVHLKIHPL